jgi:hypothetical protein
LNKNFDGIAANIPFPYFFLLFWVFLLPFIDPNWIRPTVRQLSTWQIFACSGSIPRICTKLNLPWNLRIMRRKKNVSLRTYAN